MEREKYCGRTRPSFTPISDDYSDTNGQRGPPDFQRPETSCWFCAKSGTKSLLSSEQLLSFTPPFRSYDETFLPHTSFIVELCRRRIHSFEIEDLDVRNAQQKPQTANIMQFQTLQYVLDSSWLEAGLAIHTSTIPAIVEFRKESGRNDR
jgi:hypothetical protein